MRDMCGIEVKLLRPFRACGMERILPRVALRCAPLHPGLSYRTPLGLSRCTVRSSLQILMYMALAVSLSSVAFTQGKKTTTTLKQAAVISEEEYAVYSVLLQSLYGNGTKLLVIDNYVSGCVPVGNNAEGEKAWQQSLDSLPNKLPTLTPKTIADFKSKARQCRNVEAKLTLPAKYLLFSKQARQQIFSNPDTKKAWASFYQKYAGATGYINLSNIGFNEDRTQALVNTYRKCGVRCGAEKMVLLTKANGQWSVVATHKIWEL